MKDENAGNSFSQDGSNSGTVYIRINIPELKIQKCLQFQLDDSVWQAKQRILATFAKDLKDGLNYGLYCPPSNGRAGKFLDEERFLREYPLQGPIGFLEFKYKRRVYKLLQINQRKIKQLHTKGNLKQFLDYVRGGNVEKLTKYTNKGLDPNYHDPDSGETPLTVASTLDREKVKNVVVSLVSGGAHLDFRNRLGLTCLHKAAIRGNVQALKTLLDLGASPNYKDGRGLTPLYYSVANDTEAICSELLLHDRAVIGTPDEQGWYELHHACRHGRVQHLELLIFYGADMDVQNASGNTALHVCAVNNQESCARVLLFRGASKEILNYANQVPYQVAIIAGNFDLAEIIKNHKSEDIVPFREVPSYSDRRKCTSVTPSMRAVMRCRSDPRLNILTWDKGTPDQSTPDDTQSNISWKGYNSDSPRMSISSSSSSGPGRWVKDFLRVAAYEYPRRRLYAALPGRVFVCVKPFRPAHPAELPLKRGEIVEVISVGDQGYWEGRIANQEGWFPSNHVNEVQMRPRSGSLGDIGDTVAVDRNTLAALVESRDGPRTVVLQKGKEGFGFVLRGAKSKHMPVSSLDFHPTAEYPALQYLDSVDPGSMAERAGLNSGDFILEINGHNVVQASHERVVELIKASGDTLQLKVITVRPQEKNWFVHQDGCMTLPTRGKGKAPQPPKRNPSTSLSYSKGRSKSFAEGLAEIEKLDQTLAQYDGAGSRSMNGLDKVGSADGDQKIASIRTHHAAKRSSCIQLDGELVGNARQEEKKATPPVPPKKYASPSELRIQRYHKKYQQGTLEKARSTPNLANGEDAIYATPHIQAGNGTLTKNGSNRQFSSNGYKTVLSIGSGDSDSSTSSDSVTGIARGKPKQNIYSVPNAPRVTSLRAASHSQSASNISQGVMTGNNLRASVDHSPKPVSAPTTPGVVIPPPPRKPAPQPPAKTELVKINTNSSIYANVSADIQAKKKEKAESPYESSFRPGTNAKVTKEPDVTTESVEQSKLRHNRKGSIGSLQHAQQQMSAEDRQKFLSFPRHGHSPLEFEKSPNNEGPRSVSFADDKVFENAQSFIDRHPNASLLVTADMKSGERRKLSKDLYEPEPDYDADSDDGDVVMPNNVAHKNNLAVSSRRSSSSSASSTSNRSDVPVSIHTQTRSLGISSGIDANTSVTVISVGNESPKQQASPARAESGPHYSVNSNIPRHATDSVRSRTSPTSSQEEVRESPDSLSSQIRMAALARDKRRDEQGNLPPKLPTSAPPAAPPAPPPAPAIPAAPLAPPLPQEEGLSRSRPATMSSGPSSEEIQQAAAERQNRLQNGGAEKLINRPPAGDTLRRKPLDQTQAAILAAVAKRRSVLEQNPEKDIVNQIESRLNKTKKLQSVKYYGSGAPQQKAEMRPVTAAPKTAEKPAVKTSPKPAPLKQPSTTTTTTTTQKTYSTRTETMSDKPKTQTSTTNGSNFLALAEKARQEYLQKKSTESPKKESTQADSPNKTSSGKVPPPPPIKSANTKSKLIEKSSSESRVSSENSSLKTDLSTMQNNSSANDDDDENVSIRDKIKSFEKKLDFSSVLKNSKSAYEVRGVTIDDSHTEGDVNRANGHHNNITHKDDLPPPMMAPPPAFSDLSEPVSEDVVQIEIIPPPSTFASDDQTGSPDHVGNSAFGHDDSVSLHSSVSTLSTLSSEHGEVSYSGRQITTLDEVIAPPPPGFGDSNYNDNNGFIPPPPEFQENDNSSKYQNKPFSSKAVDMWNCDDVLDWLESLNMLQYKSRFASHSIDGKRLVELNRNDYIELGVNQVGHRMSLERSIKKLALQRPPVYGV